MVDSTSQILSMQPHLKVFANSVLGACKEFCVDEPYHELFERRKVWQRSTTTASHASCWMS